MAFGTRVSEKLTAVLALDASPFERGMDKSGQRPRIDELGGVSMTPTDAHPDFDPAKYRIAPEPWKLDRMAPRGITRILDARGEEVCQVSPEGYAVRELTAQRIIECANACASFRHPEERIKELEAGR